MKGMLFAVCVLACLLVGSGCMTGGYTTAEGAHGPEADSLALSQHDIIAMSQAKIGDDVIIKMIHSTGSYFRLRSRDVVALADSGVSDKVIAAMIQTSEAPADHGTRYYYAPTYYPSYWWGAYPYYYYPWSFSVGLGWYYPYYHRAYVAPHYTHGSPYYHYSNGHYNTGHYYSGHSYTGGRTINTSRSVGRRR